MPGNGKPRPAAKKCYKMPEKVAEGEVVIDTAKVSWIIKGSIGIGGFGEIYAGAKADEPKKVNYAIKIEPLENGPLFCERNVYIQIGKKDDINEFVQMKKIKYLGIPVFYGFGSHIYKNINYRFIVIEKLGKDVWSFFKNKSMPYTTILKIGIQILHVLEYIHGKGYVHCDLKGTNLLLGEAKGSENQVYVVDFGLACKYSTTFTPNPKKAHNGTIEYTSRDAHQGVMTRRGDVEVLAYNLLHWAAGQLPWEGIDKPPAVQAQKDEALKSPQNLVSSCYKTKTPNVAIEEFFAYIGKMKPLDVPDYKKLLDILSRELKLLKSDLNKLEFKTEKQLVKSPVKKISRKKMTTAKSLLNVNNDEKEKIMEKKKTPIRKRKLTRVGSDTDINGMKDSRCSPRLKNQTKSNGVVKRSWRDFPTVVNGHRSVADEPACKLGKVD